MAQDPAVRPPGSLWAELEAFELPNLRPFREPPDPDESALHNTTNEAYPVESVQQINPWNITDADIAPFIPILHLQYPNPNAPANAQPLITAPPGSIDFTIAYRHEAGLTTRLDELFFSELNRRLNFIRWALDQNLLAKPLRLENLRVLQSEPGSCARPSSSGFLPDRCALYPSPGVSPTRCVGEIKPSYKFQGDWSLPPPGELYRLGWQNRRGAGRWGSRSHWTQYRTVLAQTSFYMRTDGGNGDGRAVKYGYIITDHEVVLVKRAGQHRIVETTPPFKMRLPVQPALGQQDNRCRQAIQGAMTAAVLIHLLASNQDDYLTVVED